MVLTPEDKAERARFHDEQPQCWMCDFLRQEQRLRTELHHIAGRGRHHDVRGNYAALCHRHHRAVQSLVDAELVCLVLKRLYDLEHYDPALICDLRGWSTTWITEADVDRCERIMGIMREVM